MGSKVNQDPRARAEKIKKIVTLFFILAAISFISGYGLFSMGKKAYIFKFTGVILLFTSTVFFLVASFMVLHEKEKHAGAYHKPKEELKQEAKENKETVPVAVEKGHKILAGEHDKLE